MWQRKNCISSELKTVQSTCASQTQRLTIYFCKWAISAFLYLKKGKVVSCLKINQIFKPWKFPVLIKLNYTFNVSTSTYCVKHALPIK